MVTWDKLLSMGRMCLCFEKCRQFWGSVWSQGDKAVTGQPLSLCQEGTPCVLTSRGQPRVVEL